MFYAFIFFIEEIGSDKAKVPGIGLDGMIAVAQGHVIELIDESIGLILQENTGGVKIVVEYVFYDPGIDIERIALYDFLEIEDRFDLMIIQLVLDIRMNRLVDQLGKIEHIDFIGQAMLFGHFQYHPLMAAGDLDIIQEQQRLPLQK
jgi:hypothetical protein